MNLGIGRVRRCGPLALIIATAALLRITGLDWDDGTYPHPDERFLIGVTHHVHSGALTLTDRDEGQRAAHLAACRDKYPATGGVGDWFDTACSDWNPANTNNASYAYGQLPLAAVRLLAEATAAISGWSGYRQYGGLHLVGRAYSAGIDLLTTLVVFLLGRLLWGRGVGLLAAAFYAVAVLPIQSSHFWTVDTTLTLWTAVAILFAARWVRFAAPADALAYGVATGLAMASKISAAPLVGLAPIAAVLGVWHVHASSERRMIRALGPLPSLMLAAAGTLIAFRVASPYAFAGQDWFSFQPAAAFLQQLEESRRLASGVVDIPPNWQWLDRAPWLYPAANIALWGLGLPLAAVALAGIAHQGWRLLRAAPIECTRAVPWLWTVGYFLWMGQQWTSTMRYFLPVYPFFCLFAAAWLVPWWRRRRSERARRDSAGWSAPAAIASFVVATTALWAFAFHTIYTTAHPYVAATHWVLRNLPGPVAAAIVTDRGTTMLINWPATGTFGQGKTPHQEFATRAPASGTIDRLQLHRGSAIPVSQAVEIEVLMRDAAGTQIASTDAITIAPEAASGTQDLELPLREPARLVGGATYHIELVVRGGPIELAGTTIAVEGPWNDAVPTRVPWPAAADVPDLHARSDSAPRGSPQVDPFGERYYVPVDLLMVGEDDAAKRARLVDALDRAEWLIVPNNRFYDSITRNPLRFPLTTRYYDALFAGDLGFERTLTVASLPRLLGVAIDDQALPKPGEGVTDPRRHRDRAAEEAFSVYDHPTVFVFRKTAAYSRERFERALDAIDTTDIATALKSVKPAGAGRINWATLAASAAPDGLLLSPEVRRANVQRQATGEERSLPGSLWASLCWYALTLLLGAIAWPWLALAWPGLPDRGYGVARIAGLALTATIGWWLASSGIAAWSASGLWSCSALLLVASAFVARALHRRDPLWPRSQLRYVATIEALFVVLFVLGIALRALDPDLWSPSFGGEKPMDYAFFNSILATTTFPPPDPWFSDGRINYYYFGWVLAGALAKMTGTVPAVAYNLALATWFALIGIGAFALAWNAVSAPGLRELASRRAAIAGGVALVAAVLLGNLDLPRALAPNVSAAWSIVSGATPSTADNWHDALTRQSERWLWVPSRTVGERPGSSFEVNEFPAFSFLYGDLHPHWMALPLQLFTLCALLALALPAFRTAVEAAREKPRAFVAALVAGVGVGWLRMANAWDWPLYWALASAAAAIAGWRAFALRSAFAKRAPPFAERIFLTFALVLVVAVVQAAVAAPFNSGFVTGALALRWFDGARTTLGAWLTIQGWFIVAIVGWAALLERRSPPLALARDRWTWNAWMALRVARGLGLAYTVAMAVVVLWRDAGEVPAQGLQVALIAWLAELLWRNRGRRTEAAGLALALAGFAIAFAVEWVVVGLDMGRMNTFFKFQLQSWLLLAVASGIAVSELALADITWRGAILYRSAFVALTIVALAYLPLATIGRAQSRFVAWTAPTLDGEAFLREAVYDYNGTRLRLADDRALIEWLRAHAGPHDVIVEAQLPEYRWGSRISVYTGRPTLLGYRHHESQQRPVPALGEAIELRKQNVAAIYESTDAAATRAILRHYGARYVIVGGLERAAYPAAGLAKLATLAADGTLEIAYRSGDDRIYRVVADRPADAPPPARW